MTDQHTTRMQRLGYRKPAEVPEPDQFVLVEYVSVSPAGAWRSSRSAGRLSCSPVCMLPPGKAMQMLMTGEAITAQEAHRLGMVNEVHPRAELMGAVLRIAEKVANNSPTAVQAVRRAVQIG